ncbi:hypothetical protein Q5752_003874 [Cryptotrichosporon argae]
MSRYSDDDLVKVWTLLGDLIEQNNNNRALIEQLKARADNAKGQAAHVGTGFPLRRFNLDISDEEFHSELEQFASHLVLENQTLQHENKQLNALLKDYEQTLEMVMGKFRGVAHASQQHDLSLHSYYTSLLQNVQTAHSSAQLHDDTSLSLLLTRLSSLLRLALRSMGGEDAPPGLASATAPPPAHPSASSSVPSPTNAQAGSALAALQFNFQSSGGYTGTGGAPDWALGREMEIARLEAENAELRAVLQIAEDEAEEERKAAAAAAATAAAQAAAPAERKGSLTVEDLEADAEHERIMAFAGAAAAEGPGAPGPGLRVLEKPEERQRGQVEESVLGFRADAGADKPPDNAIDDAEFEAL